MKKSMIMIIAGAALLLAQAAWMIYGAVKGDMPNVLSGISSGGAGYAVSYFSAGLAGAALVVWGIIKLNRTKG